MKVHLVDGTYELFRHHFAVPEHLDPSGMDVAATRGVVGSLMMMLEDGATHVAVATDHVVESFRNDLYDRYKTSEGMDPILLAQFPLLEDALTALGVTVWAMEEQEADDGLAAGAHVASDDARVEQVLICTPDKDLGQCVGGTVVQFDRRKSEMRDADGVRAKFGVGPASIPDYLALVGDTADGFPGLPGWGAKGASAVLARYRHLEDIPRAASEWDVPGLRGGAKLSRTLQDQFDEALLFRRIATVETDIDVGTPVSWHWGGPTSEFGEVARLVGAPHLAERADRIASARS